ncbi:MAG TPA: 16S rRNA (guanine(966)-N(2))-methyltransferase RsmD [Patescibacteria group bacterium]|nr:16S rRNA (guanine(966)-N(2))-methyltransferase RsmD [Patescibacteria group bacterium]
MGVGSGRIRVIAGKLRGSRIDVPDRPGLRPTPDRVRETLFNWLAPWIEGARVLDLFAGSGVLGIEALSRGAAEVDFVERDGELARHLRATLDRLKQTAAVHGGAAEQFLQGAHAPYALAFIDPPFAADLWQAVAERLETGGFLLDGAMIYVESPRDRVPLLPGHWHLHRELQAGEVRAALYRRVVPVR